jgi:hypothetical protein
MAEGENAPRRALTVSIAQRTLRLHMYNKEDIDLCISQLLLP